MTVIGIQQTNRRMCRYVFVMFIFLCWPQDVYVQGLPAVSCEAGEVTVGEEANITCIFPAGSITPGNSNFVVKKFTASNPRDGTDIMDCFHVFGSTSGIPKCIFPDMSLGYNFAFEPGNDTQTVVIPSAKHSDAGEYGCDRINHMVARCNLTVTEMITTTPVTTTTTVTTVATVGDRPSPSPTPSPTPRPTPPSDLDLIGIVIGILVGVGLLGLGVVATYFVYWYILWKLIVVILLPATEDKALTLAMLEKEYPQEAWIRAYTNGSATDGGAGMHIQYANGKWQAEAVPTGRRCTNYRKGLPCSNYRADLKALDHATNILSGTADPEDPIFIRTDAMSVLDSLVHAANTLSVTADPNAQIVFLTDAMSILEAATANKLPHLQKALQNIKCTRLVLQWIPSHCGIYGNEEAGKMAKLVAEEEQDDNGVGVTETKLIIDHKLSIQEQVIIFHLRTEHNRLNFDPPTYFHLVPSPLCPCGKAEQTIEHILQVCGNHQLLRKEIWPEPATLQEKLYGPVKALQKTAKFVCMMPNASFVFGFEFRETTSMEDIEVVKKRESETLLPAAEKPSEAAKGGDGNAKDSADASGKMPAAGNKNASEAAKDGAP